MRSTGELQCEGLPPPPNLLPHSQVTWCFLCAEEKPWLKQNFLFLFFCQVLGQSRFSTTHFVYIVNVSFMGFDVELILVRKQADVWFILGEQTHWINNWLKLLETAGLVSWADCGGQGSEWVANVSKQGAAFWKCLTYHISMSLLPSHCRMMSVFVQEFRSHWPTFETCTSCLIPEDPQCVLIGTSPNRVKHLFGILYFNQSLL